MTHICFSKIYHHVSPKFFGIKVIPIYMKTRQPQEGDTKQLAAMSHSLVTVLIPPGPLFTKRYNVFPQNIAKTRSREIGCYNDPIALKFDRHLGSGAVKFHSDWKRLDPDLAASRLREILR